MRKKNQSQRISVWMIQHIFHPLWAGPAERFLRYYPGLHERQIDLGFVTVYRKGLKRFEVHRGAEVYRIGPAIGSVKRYRLFTMRAMLLAIKKKIDVLYVFALDPPHIPFLILLKLFGIKVLFINTMARDAGDKRNIRVQLSQVLHLLILHLVSSIVFSTDEHASYLKTIGFKKMNKVQIIPNGVDINRFAPANSTTEKLSLREELELPKGDLIFLYVGLRIPRKGVLELVEAWREYKLQGNRGTLVLVGDEQRNLDNLQTFYSKLDQITNELTKDKGLIVRKPSSQIEKYFKASDVFTFLSKHEGMPNVLVEAMSSGLAVLTTRFDGFSEVFGQSGRNLLITTHKIDDILRNLVTLSDSNEISKYGTKARDWIAETQELGLILDKYAQVTKELVYGLGCRKI